MIIAIILWLILFLYLIFIPPANIFIIAGFFLILFLAIFTSTLLYFRKMKVNILIALYPICLLLLAAFQLLSILSAGILTLIFIYLLTVFSRQAIIVLT